MTGGDLESAVSDIEGEGLSVEYADDEPEDASLCTVSDQDPAGGDPAEDGDAVTLTVECRVLVPDMTEQPAEDALADLEDAGLDPSYEVDPPNASVCTVSDQSLPIDDEVDEGEPISLTLACEVPDVTSEDPDSAASTSKAPALPARLTPIRPTHPCARSSHRTQRAAPTWERKSASPSTAWTRTTATRPERAALARGWPEAQARTRRAPRSHG